MFLAPFRSNQLRLVEHAPYLFGVAFGVVGQRIAQVDNGLRVIIVRDADVAFEQLLQLLAFVTIKDLQPDHLVSFGDGKRLVQVGQFGVGCGSVIAKDLRVQFR